MGGPGGEGGNHIHMENGGKNTRPFRRFRSLYSDVRVNITVAHIYKLPWQKKNVRSHSEKLLLHGES